MITNAKDCSFSEFVSVGIAIGYTLELNLMLEFWLPLLFDGKIV
jgi:hypothetical protein